MLDETPTPDAAVDAADTGETADPGADKPTKKAAAKKAPAKKAAAKKTAAKKAAAKKTAAPAEEPDTAEAAETTGESAPPKAKRTRKKAAAAPPAEDTPEQSPEPVDGTADEAPASVPLFQVPQPTVTTRRRRPTKAQLAAEAAAAAEEAPDEADETSETDETEPPPADDNADEKAGETVDENADENADENEAETGDDAGGGRRRRRRGGRRRRKSGDGVDSADSDAESTVEADAKPESPQADTVDEAASEGTSRRRRRRRRSGDDGDGGTGDDPQNTVTRVRKVRNAEDEITAVSGSTRLEAKKQRRREGREAGRRRAPIVSEAEFLARREAVERVMVIRQRDELTQIGVLEDKVLVEHYVARESQTSLIGNVYLGRVQNVLPSMEAAFVDIGKGRNAVLYAGEVNWSALVHPDGQQRKIESVLSSGQQILVQVTKDPIGHKGARLTSQVSLAGRFLVYVPDGTTSGISRKLPDTERNRLKTLLKEIVPDTAGVIVRTAAEGASEDELTRDVERLKARWEDIEKKAKGSAPQLLYGEPDLTLKVVRDLFTEDFTTMVIEGDDAWETVQDYVVHVAPDLQDRLERYRPEEHDGRDVYAAYRLDEQIAKGLDRKVWLPSGGSLVIDRTEAMTVVDVNTGKFTGSGGNLEETVTKNNLEAAEEIVRQLRLRDIGGIIVVDFIDMVLESNRDLVLRRLVECLGRDRTRHQVAEVTSLGLVQMTRKRIGTGLLEAFSHECEHCHGRGVVIKETPVEPRRSDDDGGRRTGRRGRGRGDQQPNGQSNGRSATPPTPKDVAAMAKHHAEHPEHTESTDPEDEVVEAEVAVEVDAPVEEAPVEEAPVEEVPVEETPVEETSVEPEPEREPTSPPEPPKVVTRSRRRAASRPAGPPPVVPAPEVATGSVLVEDAGTRVDGEEHDHHESGPALHVPVKRRGSRKR
ncbi:MAG TPA: Rne/Rng family ribonuclease [Nocardioides sp.]|nr:Rne/Rng family ribonuclease [Nocardioides sp.]